jgi:hypothetical protein
VLKIQDTLPEKAQNANESLHMAPYAHAIGTK